MKSKYKWLVFIMFLFVILFWFTHRNPYISVRTAVFSKGYFSIGLHSKVENKGNDLYSIEPAPVETNTASELKTYRVNKKWVFYFAEYYGEV